MLTDRVWGGTTGAGAVLTAPKLPAATGCRIRISVVCLFTAKYWRWAEGRLWLRCVGGGSENKTSKFHAILIFKWAFAMRVLLLPV